MTAAMLMNGMLAPGVVTMKSDADLTVGNFNYLEGAERLGVDGTDLVEPARTIYKFMAAITSSFLLSANKSQLLLDPSLDHVEATNEFLHSALGLKLPRLREQDYKELSLLFKAVQPAMLDALSAYICDFQLEGLVAADLVLAGFIRGGAPNRVYVPMIPKMDNNAALPPVFTERLRFASQSPLNSNCITVETFSKALGECVKVGAFTVLWTYVNRVPQLSASGAQQRLAKSSSNGDFDFRA